LGLRLGRDFQGEDLPARTVSGSLMTPDAPTRLRLSLWDDPLKADICFSIMPLEIFLFQAGCIIHTLPAWFFFWHHRHLARITKPHTLGYYFRVVSKDQMHNASFVGWHRLQGARALAHRNLLGNVLGQSTQRLITALLVAIHIQYQRDRSSQFLRHNQAFDILQGSQCLPAPSNEQAQVLPADIEHQRRTCRFVLVRNWGSGLQLDARGEFKTGEEVFKHLLGNCSCLLGQVRSFCDDGGAYPSLLFPYA
jgi:hypothetical protein